MAILLEKLLRIRTEETSFAKRRFRSSCNSARVILERVGETFLRGYHAALIDKGPLALAADLESVDPEFRGFAYEGASMALSILDQLAPWKRGRLQSLMAGPGLPHIYMVHVGVGWAIARLQFRIERRLAQLDPLLRWLALDGFGFHEGYFHWQHYQDGKSLPRKLRGYQLRAFDQGLGRSLWFIGGADPEQINRLVREFPGSRRGDLWSGVGLACTYAGAAGLPAMSSLREGSGNYYQHLAQGAVFAAKTRERAGNVTQHTDLACRTLCGLSVQDAASIADATLPRASEAFPPDCPAYEIWRRRIRTHFASPEADREAAATRDIEPETSSYEFQQEVEHVQYPEP
jgi:enediyne biosynthesis protein E3